MRKKLLIALAGIAAAIGLSIVAPSAPAESSVIWGPAATHSDFAGNGQLQITYRTRQGYSIGFYVEALQICADDGGVAFRGISGKGIWIRNENGVTKFSTNNDDLDPGKCRSWDLEISMPDADTLRSGWLFDEIYVPGGNLQQCARLTIQHSSWSSGSC